MCKFRIYDKKELFTHIHVNNISQLYYKFKKYKGVFQHKTI